MNYEAAMNWDEVSAIPPARSRLYRLEPIGLGTPLVECLTSYIHRLAAAHGLPTWVLVCREIAPQFRRKSMLTANGHCDLFGKVGITINGNNDTARETVAVLQMLTGQPMVRDMTFCRLGGLVAAHRILRGTQAWCPTCLDEWHQDGRIIYRPLIWLLSPLKSCPTHGCSLEDRCPGCGQHHASLVRYQWNGVCPRCSVWLGKIRRGVGRCKTAPLSAWDAFTALVLGRFVAAMQSLPDDLPETTFPSNVTDLMQTRFGGNCSGLARPLRVHRSTVSDWANGSGRPSLTSLVGLAHCFGGEAMDWITGKVDPAHMAATRQIALADSAKLRRPLRRQQPEIVRVHLTAATNATEHPPRSLTAVCKQLGANQGSAKRLFPDLATKIMSNYRIYRDKCKRTREHHRTTEVQSAVRQLLATGRTVSYNQLSKVLPPRVSARDRLVRQEFKRLRAESACA